MGNMEQHLWEQIIALEDAAQIAYIRPFSINGDSGYAVHASDGTQLAVFQNYDTAFFTARQHNLFPVSVH
jgi:hypothetical protein